MRVVDLSHTIEEGMPVFPGDPTPAIRPGLTHERDYCHVDRLRLGSHTGTHVDAPFHFLAAGRTIDAIAAGRFVGHGVLFDATGLAEGAEIPPEALAPRLGRLAPGDFAVIRTGWDRFWGRPRYRRHPFLGAAAARMLAEAGAGLVAVDALNVDATGEHPEAFPVHELLLEREIMIVENLCNLGEVEEVRGLYAFLPLKLKGSDGSPVRAVHIAL